MDGLCRIFWASLWCAGLHGIRCKWFLYGSLTCFLSTSWRTWTQPTEVNTGLINVHMYFCIHLELVCEERTSCQSSPWWFQMKMDRYIYATCCMIVAYGSAWGIVAKGGMEVYTLRYLRWTCATLPFMETVCWYGATNGLFVHSSEFAAEWWNNIDGWTMIWCFWTLHETCMLFWDKVCGEQHLMWKCNSLSACYALRVNWWCLWTTSFSLSTCMFVVNNKQTNQLYLLPNCVLHFSEAACRFSQHVYGEDECFGNLMKSCDVNVEMEMVGEFNQAEFTWTNDECFAPLPFSPDGTAERRRHSTVHVHETTCFACFPVWKRI